MRKIIYINSLGESIILSNKAPFILYKIEGVGGVKANIQLKKAPFQDGYSYLDNTLESRSINMECGIFGGTSEEKMKLRRKVVQILNPKLGPGVLRYEYDGGVKQIEAICEEAPIFPGGKENVSPIFQRMLINLLCPAPFWFDEYEESEEIATWVGGIKFNLTLPTKFASKGAPRKLINNVGDVETPVTIIFQGPATNPKITNLITGEFIKVKRSLLSTDILIINTGFGDISVDIVDGSGNKTNVFNWITLDSSFWQLKKGDNIIEYSSDNQIEPAAVSINYKNRYFGI